jgi:hypothetical protein
VVVYGSRSSSAAAISSRVDPQVGAVLRDEPRGRGHGHRWGTSELPQRGHNVTRNEFAGSSDKIMEVDASHGVKYYSDNKKTGSYPSVGMNITPGPGPLHLPGG